MSLWHNPKSYCLSCEEVVIGYPWNHEAEEHPDSDVDVKRIKRMDSDGQYITKPDVGMGHYGPHHFIEIDGVDTCPECGALRVEGGS